MTRREKYLALTVGVIIVFLVGWSAVARIGGAFTARQDAIARLAREIAGKKMILTRGTRAAAQIEEFE